MLLKTSRALAIDPFLAWARPFFRIFTCGVWPGGLLGFVVGLRGCAYLGLAWLGCAWLGLGWIGFAVHLIQLSGAAMADVGELQAA